MVEYILAGLINDVNDVVGHFVFAYLLINLVFKSGEWVKWFLYREAPLRDAAPYRLYTLLIEKIPLSYFRYWPVHIPSFEHFTPFNSCECTVSF